jgi:hypothetical protein
MFLAGFRSVIVLLVSAVTGWSGDQRGAVFDCRHHGVGVVGR